MPVIRAVRAFEGEIVEIKWTANDGTVYIRRYTIPPKAVPADIEPESSATKDPA